MTTSFALMHTGCWHSRSAGCSSHPDQSPVDAAMCEACSGSKSYTLAFETLGVKMVTVLTDRPVLCRSLASQRGLGRQDSSGHLTLHLLPGSTTQLLAATQTAAPGHASAGMPQLRV